MSAYICDNKTISVIARAFVDYQVDYLGDNYESQRGIIIDLQKERNAIGQSLLCQNYRSVNYRYGENELTPKFECEDVPYDEGILVGCIHCYEYQACETDDYFESDIHKSLMSLQEAILVRMIRNKGQEIPWGYELYERRISNEQKNQGGSCRTNGTGKGNGD